MLRPNPLSAAVDYPGEKVIVNPIHNCGERILNPQHVYRQLFGCVFRVIDVVQVNTSHYHSFNVLLLLYYSVYCFENDENAKKEQIVKVLYGYRSEMEKPDERREH